MIERLETTLKKYNELEQELTRPEVLSNVKKTIGRQKGQHFH